MAGQFEQPGGEYDDDGGDDGDDGDDDDGGQGWWLQLSELMGRPAISRGPC